MNNHELEALRRLLFFSASEAADLIGQCAHRTWQRWESGDRNVPSRISDDVAALVEWRSNALAAMRAQVAQVASKHGMPDCIEIVWYATLDDWLNSGEERQPIHWRPHQSVLAQISSEYPHVKFI